MIKVFTDKKHLAVRDKWYQGYLKRFMQLWLYGDGRDITSEMFEDKKCKGEILVKENGVIAGIEEVRWFCKESGVRCQFKVKDGEKIRKGQVIGTVNGSSRDVLKIERLILNVLGKMSGIATNAARLKLKDVLLVPTRKTDWGPMDKKACLIGGCGTHRLGLWDAVLIKDNHLALGGDIKKMPKDAKFIEVEAANVREIGEALSKIRSVVGIPIVVMLDNFEKSHLKSVMKNLKDSGYYVELSGGINEENLSEYAKYKPDVMSMSGLTRGVKPLDMGLDLV